MFILVGESTRLDFGLECRMDRWIVVEEKRREEFWEDSVSRYFDYD